MSSVAPGEVILRDAWRSFSPRGDQGRTLKELIAQRGRRRAAELPATQALAGVNLRVAPGDTLGIVGRNGAGKTSTLRVLAGIIPLHRGQAEVGGRIATLIDLASGFGREFTGRENIHLTAALHGMSREEVEARIGSIIEFSELGHFVDTPIKTYSSGMLVRLGFAIAAHLEADVLLIDEVLAVGDEAFQRKCLRHIAARIEAGTTLVLVSHAPATIEAVCRRVVVLDHGRVTFDGPTAEGLRHYHDSLGTEDPEREEARRRDNSPVWIEQAWLAGADGEPRQVFEAGEPLRLIVELAARPDAPDVALVVHVRDGERRSVFNARETLPTAQTGGGRVEIAIDRLPLLAGSFEIPLGVDIPGDPVTGIDRLLSFSVRPAAGGEGVVDLRGKWSFQPLGAVRR